ncbi:thioredoxin-interacting protein [Strongylocentrotus purpuratus]|uniref:Arrestin-like N-terminal domain-containing protein n=1 Tax=Strongylocentrotus purpuratus TaxID=7668 RepID=A0A7M7NBD8_STRPU|nr:thioredoxin-interacting protein [Strongylocentrotus purpuratus]
MELFGINLTAGRETYVVGDVISGEVIIQSSKDEVIEDLVVSICGIAHVEWKKCFTKYQETESYYNVKKTLIDVTSARKERKLSRRVPWVKYFELDVPEDTFPPNFYSDHGYIRNDVTVTLKLKGGKEHVTSRPFKIIDVTSLATHFEDSQRSCSQVSSFRSSTQSWTRIRLPAHILPCEGDSSVVKIGFECSPGYCKDEIDLIQRIDYRVNEVNVFTKYSVINCNGTRRQSGGDVTWTELIVPKKQLPIIHHCRLISVRYYLKKSPIKSDKFSWLPLSWQRGPEILIINSLHR